MLETDCTSLILAVTNKLNEAATSASSNKMETLEKIPKVSFSSDTWAKT